MGGYLETYMQETIKEGSLVKNRFHFSDSIGNDKLVTIDQMILIDDSHDNYATGFLGTLQRIKKNGENTRGQLRFLFMPNG